MTCPRKLVQRTSWFSGIMTSYGGVCQEEEVPEGQIAFAMKQAKMGTPVVEVTRKVGITVQNYVGHERACSSAQELLESDRMIVL